MRGNKRKPCALALEKINQMLVLAFALAEDDVFDFQLGHFLTMAFFHAGTFAALHFESDQFGASEMFFDFDFEYFDEYGLQDFIDFLRNNKNYMNSSVTKNLSLIKVVIRWAYRRGFHNNNKFETFKPKMKTTQRKWYSSPKQSWIK